MIEYWHQRVKNLHFQFIVLVVSWLLGITRLCVREVDLLCMLYNDMIIIHLGGCERNVCYCQNGGSCIDQSDTCNCNCRSGWTGDHCTQCKLYTVLSDHAATQITNSKKIKLTKMNTIKTTTKKHKWVKRNVNIKIHKENNKITNLVICKLWRMTLTDNLKLNFHYSYCWRTYKWVYT